LVAFFLTAFFFLGAAFFLAVFFLVATARPPYKWVRASSVSAASKLPKAFESAPPQTRNHSPATRGARYSMAPRVTYASNVAW
jgi:hypothetical protein